MDTGRWWRGGPSEIEGWVMMTQAALRAALY